MPDSIATIARRFGQSSMMLHSAVRGDQIAYGREMAARENETLKTAPKRNRRR